MPKHEQYRFTRVFHTIVAILLLLTGGAALGFGIWLSVTNNANTYKLDFGNGNSFRSWLSASNITIGVGVFLLLTAVVSLIALTRECVGKTFRIIYALMAILIMLALVATCVISIVILRNRNDAEVRTFVRDAWEETIRNDNNTVCEIEKALECKGFDDDDCKVCVGIENNCDVDVCASCGISKFVGVGCFEMIVDRLWSLFLPTAIVSGVLALVVLMDIFFICCL